MRNDQKIIVTFIVLTVIVALIYFATRRTTTNQQPGQLASSAGKIGTPDLYPDSKLTPGRQEDASADDLLKRWPCPAHARAGADGLCTYSASHRNVSAAEKRQVYADYEVLHPGITGYCKEIPNGREQRCEVDHFIPECAGGGNDPDNLWIQRADWSWKGQPMGFHEKDELEDWGCEQIKSRRLNPAEFARRLTNDWVAYYLEVRPAH